MTPARGAAGGAPSSASSSQKKSGCRRQRLWPWAIAAAAAAGAAAVRSAAESRAWLAAGGCHRALAPVQRQRCLLRRAQETETETKGTEVAELDDSLLDELAGDLEELYASLEVDEDSNGDSNGANGANGVAEVAEEAAASEVPAAEAAGDASSTALVRPGAASGSGITVSELKSDMESMGLEAAPDGSGYYLATLENIQALVDQKTKGYKTMIHYLEKYVDNLETELDDTIDQLEAAEAKLAEEQRLRIQAETERDSLEQRRTSLEVQVQEADTEAQSAEEVMDELDRKAEEIALRLERGEITEEEAEAEEEEIMRAEARRMSARQAAEERKEELQDVNFQVEQAKARASSASGSEAELREQLEAMREEMARLTEERDLKAKKAEAAEFKFENLVEKIKAKGRAKQQR